MNKSGFEEVQPAFADSPSHANNKCTKTMYIRLIPDLLMSSLSMRMKKRVPGLSRQTKPYIMDNTTSSYCFLDEQE